MRQRKGNVPAVRRGLVAAVGNGGARALTVDAEVEVVEGVSIGVATPRAPYRLKKDTIEADRLSGAATPPGGT